MFALYALGYPSSFLNSSETKFLNHKIHKTCFTCRRNTSDGINKKYCSKFGIALAWSICILSKSFNFRKVSWIPWAQRHLCSKAFFDKEFCFCRTFWPLMRKGYLAFDFSTGYGAWAWQKAYDSSITIYQHPERHLWQPKRQVQERNGRGRQRNACTKTKART